MDPGHPTSLTINGVAVDFDSESLRGRDGGAVPLRPQAFATLRHLILNAGRLVSKEELNASIWRGTAVTDDSLVQCIHEIRLALGDSRRTVLQTVTRRGYRLHLPDGAAGTGPSVAVLPFTSLGEAAGQEHFADGLAEDLITNLSKVPGLLVIARNSSFAYRDRTVDARTIAAELGVRCLVEGSVRRAGDRLRITAHLLDGATGGHVWAGRFDGAAADVFDLQDRITEQIAGIVEPALRRAEIGRARAKRGANLDAYDLYLRALPHALANTGAETDIALELLAESLRLDPSCLAAHGYAAWCHEQRYLRGGFDPADREAALRHAEVALGVNADDPQAMSIAAFVRANLTCNYDAAIEVLDRALAMNGNSALALGFSALVSAHSERDERAQDHARKALRLSPLDDPFNYHPYCALALTSLFAGRHADAVAYARLSIRANPAFSVTYAYLAAGHVGLGEIDEARAAGRRLLEVSPGFTVAEFARMDLFRPALMQSLVAALRAAELPET